MKRLCNSCSFGEVNVIKNVFKKDTYLFIVINLLSLIYLSYLYLVRRCALNKDIALFEKPATLKFSYLKPY